jgi:hypothetical protein
MLLSLSLFDTWQAVKGPSCRGITNEPRLAQLTEAAHSEKQYVIVDLIMRQQC